jgi:hypothetical protein
LLPTRPTTLEPQTSADAVAMLPPDLIDPNPIQPRRVFQPEFSKSRTTACWKSRSSRISSAKT